MKSYDETTNNLLERREQYIAKQSKNRKRIVRITSVACSFVLVALITKIIGCGIVAKICRFNFADSLKIGVGMMTRGEVALIVAQKGLSVGLLNPVYFTSVILLIIASSISTPIILKLLYARDKRLGIES